MRELRFRVWYKVESKFLDSSILLAEIRSKQILWEDDQNPKAIEFFDDNYTFCEYTGLKDKNGVEIYEGDILQDNKGKTFEVKWNELYASFGMRDPSLGRNSAPLRGLHPASQLEVIGNIYENQDLLESKK